MEKSPDAFRTISEVADWLGTPTHVLRFWESRFSQVKPVKRAGGRRYYRPADMALLGGIKKLLHDDGLTIRGVQKILREQGVKHVTAMSPPVDGFILDDTAPDTPAPAPTSETPAPAAGAFDASPEPEPEPEPAPDPEQPEPEPPEHAFALNATPEPLPDPSEDTQPELPDFLTKGASGLSSAQSAPQDDPIVHDPPPPEPKTPSVPWAEAENPNVQEGSYYDADVHTFEESTSTDTPDTEDPTGPVAEKAEAQMQPASSGRVSFSFPQGAT
ncbi:MAG: MerR family transcriptional regulator, partial [Pseudomonadota bacterium]